jgi:cyclopropane-fatty-acyl-phospholipid synthase
MENEQAVPRSAQVPSKSNPSVMRSPVLASFSAMRRGHLRVELPDGTTEHFGAGEESLPLGLSGAASIVVRREAFFRKCVLSGDIGFAESYIDGDWSTPNLAAVVAFFILNVDTAPTLSGSSAARGVALNFLRAANRLGQLLRAGSLRGARRNISEHYDLSNDFFALFLDPTMMYSAARWVRPGMTLEEAQTEKNERLCSLLRLTASDHVLEIGTGWGGWAAHAARTRGCRITTVTLSARQAEFARRRIASEGLEALVDVRHHDFRQITGRYDKIVSIEMVEALGHGFLREFCQVVGAALKPDGLIAMQFITCPDARYESFRTGVDFIQKHIFPGSLLLSLNRMNELLSSEAGLILNNVEDMGHDYAITLRRWSDAFSLKLEEVRALGFDERFIRKWSYYLAYCEAAFAMRNISVVQTLHTRPNNLALGGGRP